MEHMQKISLLELMHCKGNVHSAESTAQRFLRFIASQYTTVGIDDRTSTQTVSPTLLSTSYLYVTTVLLHIMRVSMQS